MRGSVSRFIPSAVLIAVALALLMTSPCLATAQTICNKGDIDIYYAVNKGVGGWGGSYETEGWWKVSPGDCSGRGLGAANGISSAGGWVAILYHDANGSKRIVTDRMLDSILPGDLDRPYNEESNRQFCVSLDGFKFQEGSESLLTQCGSGSYLVPFAVSCGGELDLAIDRNNTSGLLVGNSTGSSTATNADGPSIAATENKCDHGHANACSNLGVLLIFSNSPSDKDHAVALFQKACNMGSAVGCNNLGAAYLYGEGVAKDAARGDQLRGRACKAGLRDACGGNKYVIVPWAETNK